MRSNSETQAWKKIRFYPILFIPQNVNFILDTLPSIAFSPNFIPKSAVLSDPRSRDLQFFTFFVNFYGAYERGLVIIDITMACIFFLN